MTLPEADFATRAALHVWLETFAGYVRDVDYAAARPLWHPEVLIFGTHQDVLQGIDAYRDTQWHNVWPRTADFRFDLARTRVLLSDDASMATVFAPWTSTGFAADGTPFDRPGRATLVFHRARAQAGSVSTPICRSIAACRRPATRTGRSRRGSRRLTGG